MFMIPTWVKQLDTTDKLITYLMFIGREDLIAKFETQGYLQLGEIFETPIGKLVGWLYDCESDNFIDFTDFGKEAP